MSAAPLAVPSPRVLGTTDSVQFSCFKNKQTTKKLLRFKKGKKENSIGKKVPYFTLQTTKVNINCGVSGDKQCSDRIKSRLSERKSYIL